MKKNKRITAAVMAFAMLATMFGNPAPVRAESSSDYSVKTSDGKLVMSTTAKSTKLNEGDTIKVKFTVHGIDKFKALSGTLQYDTDALAIATSDIKVPDYNQSGAHEPEAWKGAYNDTTKVIYTRWDKDGSYKIPKKSEESREYKDLDVMTVTFKLKKSVCSTKISLVDPDLFREGKDGTPGEPAVTTGSSVTVNNDVFRYRPGLEMTLENSQAKTIKLSTRDVSGHNTILIPVYFDVNSGFKKLTFTAKFDNTKLRYDEFQRQAVWPKELKTGTVEVDGNGNLTVTLESDQMITTTGILFYLKFKRMDPPAANTPAASVPKIPVTLNIVSAEDGEKNPYYLNDAVSQVSYAEKDYGRGDVNGDGKISLVDAMLIMRYYNKTRVLTEAEQKAADVNNDGTINLVDVVILMQYYNGVIKALPAN